MAWNPSPEVADARALARKWKRQQIVIFAIGKDRTVQMVTYGETLALCDDAKHMGQYLWEKLMKDDAQKPTHPMTSDEQREYDYRYEERLGILCADAEPTEEQKAIAKSEADAWLAESRGELLL